MRELNYLQLRCGEYKEIKNLERLPFEEFLDKIVPIRVYQEGFFELYILKLEKRNFGIVRPIYEIFYSKTKNGALLKEDSTNSICINQSNLQQLVSLILNAHGILDTIMSSGIQRSNDPSQMGPKV